MYVLTDTHMDKYSLARFVLEEMQNQLDNDNFTDKDRVHFLCSFPDIPKTNEPDESIEHLRVECNLLFGDSVFIKTYTRIKHALKDYWEHQSNDYCFGKLTPQKHLQIATLLSERLSWAQSRVGSCKPEYSMCVETHVLNGMACHAISLPN